MLADNHRKIPVDGEVVPFHDVTGDTSDDQLAITVLQGTVPLNFFNRRKIDLVPVIQCILALRF